MLNEIQKAFMKCLGTMERSEGLRQYEAFAAFLELAFCATAKPATFNSDLKAGLEARYMEQIGRFRHPQESAAAAAEALGHLTTGLEWQVTDFLGEILMELGGNPHTGQFFTPWAVSQMMAELNFDESLVEKVKGGHILTIQEPACGCGSMVLAFGEALKRRDIDPARDCHFELIDVDLRCAQAAYIQCTLMGISATVTHGNTLSLETWGAWHTITAMLHPKWSRIAAQRGVTAEIIPAEQPAEPAAPAPTKPQPVTHQQLQLAL